MILVDGWGCNHFGVRGLAGMGMCCQNRGDRGTSVLTPGQAADIACGCLSDVPALLSRVVSRHGGGGVDEYKCDLAFAEEPHSNVFRVAKLAELRLPFGHQLWASHLGGGVNFLCDPLRICHSPAFLSL